MSDDKKVNGKMFEEGNTASVGQTRLTSEELASRKMNKIEFERIANKYMYKTLEEMELSLKDRSTPIIEVIVLKTLHECARTGKWNQLEFIMNRLLGKPKESVELTNPDGSMKPQVHVHIRLPDNGKGAKS